MAAEVRHAAQGRIMLSPQVWCGIPGCEHCDDAMGGWGNAGIPGLIPDLKKRGWTYSFTKAADGRKIGWVCPEHSKTNRED